MTPSKSTPLLTLLFGLCLLSISCQQTKPKDQSSAEKAPTQCIKEVFAMDDSLGSVRNHACEKISLSATIQTYVKDIRAIDYKNCPEAFTAAFQKHSDAWEAMIAVTDHYPELRGEMHDLFDQIEVGEHAAQFKPALKAIWDTWAEIEAVGK